MFFLVVDYWALVDEGQDFQGYPLEPLRFAVKKEKDISRLHPIVAMSKLL